MLGLRTRSNPQSGKSLLLGNGSADNKNRHERLAEPHLAAPKCLFNPNHILYHDKEKIVIGN